ncbi:MAG: hypothetical protein BRC33_08440 [Cyanobacteria bacterium SW_9_44_58]|nr:MAG: hypothetical protein BRC33_08440 [Cyanobacteria bacterium SW_9_44_58]
MFPLHQSLLKIALVTTSFLFAGSGLDIILNKALGGNPFQISAIGQAQAYNEQQLKNYAQAVLAIEKLRQNTFGEIQNVLDSQEVPKVACNRSESYKDLPSDARSLIINYCNRSKEIVQQQGLTVSEFNQITKKMKSNPELKQKVQQQMLQAQ